MLKKVFAVVLILGFVSILTTVHLFVERRSHLRQSDTSASPLGIHRPTVYIIGKAAIADYLWLHILEGHLNEELNGFYRTGSIECDEFTIRFLSGPGYIQTTIPHDIEYLVLVLNGRTDDKKRAAVLWLDNLDLLRNLRKVGVVLLGNESCENEWILKYMKSHGGVIDILFVVYDWKLVDNVDIFQWPLGVATYRGFPLVKDFQVAPSSRKHACNFVGTVYKNSSRSRLNEIMLDRQFSFNCVRYVRNTWSPKENSASLRRYINALNDSDFTLCPIGRNPECYRIFEALSFGSVPIVEDVASEGRCSSPLRLLKEHNPPFIYIKDWSKLISILNNFQHKRETLAQLRQDNLLWYKSFKKSMKAKFIKVLEERFFSNFDSH